MASLAVPIGAPPRDVVEFLQRELPSFGWRLVPSPPGIDVQAHTRMNLASWTDRIQVQVVPQGKGSLCLVTSRPRFQVYNWGQDDSNVGRVAQALLLQFPGAAPAQAASRP